MRRLDHAEDARDLRQLAEQSDRRRADARRPRGDRRARARARPVGDLRRSLRRRRLRRREHISIASLPGMYERTIPLYTFSKTYAMTGLRLAYVAVHESRRFAIACARCSSTPSPTRRRSSSTAASARSQDRRTCVDDVPHGAARRGAICSTPAFARRRPASSAARHRPARSTRFSRSIRPGDRRCRTRRRRSRGR